jgi:hypothetical protein
MEVSSDGQPEVTEASQSRRRRKAYLRLRVNGVWLLAVLDTGSDTTLLPESAVTGVELTRCSRKVLAANRTPIEVKGRATVEANIGRHQLRITGLVTSHVSEVLLGLDFLLDHDATWSVASGRIELDGHNYYLSHKGSTFGCRRVVMIHHNQS